MLEDHEVYDSGSTLWLGVVTVDQTEEMTAGISVPAGTKVCLECFGPKEWEATVPKGLAAPIAPFDFNIDEAHFEILEEYPDFDSNCRICGAGTRIAGILGGTSWQKCSHCGEILPLLRPYPNYDPNRSVTDLDDLRSIEESLRKGDSDDDD